jgi:hypothetical protein
MPPRKRADAGLRELPDYPNPKPKSTTVSKRERRPHLIPAADLGANLEVAQTPYYVHIGAHIAEWSAFNIHSLN